MIKSKLFQQERFTQNEALAYCLGQMPTPTEWGDNPNALDADGHTTISNMWDPESLDADWQFAPADRAER